MLLSLVFFLQNVNAKNWKSWQKLLILMNQIKSYLLNDLMNFNDICSKNVPYDNIKCHQKSRLQPPSRKHSFGKTNLEEGQTNTPSLSSANEVTRLSLNITGTRIPHRCFPWNVPILTCSALLKFRFIHRKTPVLEKFFNAVAVLRLANALQSDSSRDVFLEVLWNF